jgi:hypothetical protein
MSSKRESSGCAAVLLKRLPIRSQFPKQSLVFRHPYAEAQDVIIWAQVLSRYAKSVRVAS